MVFALTFGSVGDIIAVCQIAIQLSRALGAGCGESRGSAKEYQYLRKDLDLFVQVLMHVVATFEQHEPSPALTSLDRAMTSIVDECGTLIKSVLDRLVPRYDDTLKPGGSGSTLKDTYKKVKWLATEKEGLQSLQDKLRKNTEMLSLLISIAVRYSARADNATVLARIEEVRQQIDNQRQAQETLLRHLSSYDTMENQQNQLLLKINERLDEQCQARKTGFEMATRAFRAIVQVKDILIDVANRVVFLQDMISNFIYIRPLDPTKGLPIMLEDPFGYISPLPDDWVKDWEDLNRLLEMRFKEKQTGYEMVLKRQFALEENCTGNDLNRAIPLTACLRRGMKIDMSMVFVNSKILQGSCPRCQTKTDAPEDITISCPNPHCGMWFRILKLLIQETSGFDNDEAETETFAVPAEPSDFQRVRLLRPVRSHARRGPTEADDPESTIPMQNKNTANLADQLRELSILHDEQPHGNDHEHSDHSRNRIKIADEKKGGEDDEVKKDSNDNMNDQDDHGAEMPVEKHGELVDSHFSVSRDSYGSSNYTPGPHIVWKCCQCQEGWFSTTLNSQCPNCHTYRCVSCAYAE